MKIKSTYKHLKIIFVLILILAFFIFFNNQISYGLPYFWNPDEIDFQNSLISVLYLITDQIVLSYNPLYAPLLNAVILLNSVFVNEVLINSLSPEQIKSKIYFNPELFLFYGRQASLIVSSISIFFLYLIFKKLKINYFISIILLTTFMTSLVMFNISTIMGKNSSNLLIYLIQVYFLIKYLFKIEKFNFNSYLIFGILASLAWGVNYWPAFISMYAVLFLHLKKYKFSKIHYLATFGVIFIIFGPVINLFFVDTSPFEFFKFSNPKENIQITMMVASFFDRIIISFKTLYFVDKNIILLIAVTPIFLLNKRTKFKNEFLIIFILFLEPIILFGLTGGLYPQLRYFGGITCVILILIAFTFKELNKINFKFFTIILILFNIYLMVDNVFKINKITNVLSKNHSFFNFNKDIEVDRSEILYLVDLNFQESLDQNKYYLNLYENNLIIKNEISEKFLNNIDKKNKKITKSKNFLIEKPDLKKDIIYHNYTFFPIKDLGQFFEFIKKDFNYVVIEESFPPYLSDSATQKEIKSYVKENFKLKHIEFEQNKILLRYQQSVIHYYSNTLTPYDIKPNSYDKNSEVIYGSNFSLYELK